LTRKVAVIGLDGAAWQGINVIMENGELENIREMKEKGVVGGLKSTLPPQWSCLGLIREW
jgi:predicted AlkP superfamily phosphohydrolase/phosphomutase